MGVRFQCPNGHPLHVKADLAGKRGICPDCGARFIVPSFSGERVAAVTAVGLTGGVQTGVHDSPLSLGSSIRIESEPSAVPQDGTQAPESDAWYIRPAAGGQYGPATTELFQQWVSEGRVAADSWVWRTGWEQWKPAAEALARSANGRAPVNHQSVGQAFEAGEPQATVLTEIDPFEARETEARRAEVRRRNRARGLSLVLGILALAMIALLVVVLAH
jgi:hypothetical protein